MTVDERLELLVKHSEENWKQIEANSKQIEANSKQIAEHSKQLETDGRHIRQLAMIVQDQSAEFDKIADESRRINNAIETLAEISSRHETRLNR